jgi:hypothetical protein
LVIKVSSDPAENTSTSPLGIAVAELDALADAGVEVDAAAVLEELLHPARASPVHAIASRATTGPRFVAMRGIIRQTLPLLVARRKYLRPTSRKIPLKFHRAGDGRRQRGVNVVSVKDTRREIRELSQTWPIGTAGWT